MLVMPVVALITKNTTFARTVCQILDTTRKRKRLKRMSMTRKKAIEYLEWIRPKKPYTLDRKNVQEAIDMGIEALKKYDDNDDKRNIDKLVAQAYRDGWNSGYQHAMDDQGLE